MADAIVGRYSTLGVYVSFRLEGTMELLWKSPMLILPRPNDLVGHRVNGEVETWHKVESVKWEFEADDSVTFGDPPQQFKADHSRHGVSIVVSLVP